MDMDSFNKKTSILIIFLVLVLTACGQMPGSEGGTDEESSLVKTIPPATLTAISEAALAQETAVPDPLGVPWEDLDGIELDFWYIWDLDQPGIGMNAIVDRFNAENEWGITIYPVDQGLVIDPLTSIETAFEEGLVPHILISDASAIAGWYLDGLTVDLSTMIEDPAAGLTQQEVNGFYERVWNSFRLNEENIPGLPFSQSIQVIYYNQSWAKELRFSLPPDSLEDYLEQACAAAAELEPGPDSTFQGTGILLTPDPDFLWSSMFAHDAEVIDLDSGYEFSSTEVISMAESWKSLIKEGCGTVLYSYPDPMASELVFDNFNRREAIMVMGSSRLMSHVHTEANRTGRADDWLMLPFMGTTGNKVVTSDVQAGVIFRTTPAEELASWLFLKYLVSPEVQAEWAQYSGDYPANRSSLRFLRDYRDEHPNWSQGLNLLKYALPEPLDPSWNSVQLAVGDAFDEILRDMTLDLSDQLEMLDTIALELWEYSRQTD